MTFYDILWHYGIWNLEERYRLNIISTFKKYQALSPVPEPLPEPVKWEYDHNFALLAASNKSKVQVLSPIHLGNYKLNKNKYYNLQHITELRI